MLLTVGDECTRLLSIMLLFCFFLARTDICLLPPDAGLCDGVFFKYFYNDTNGNCEVFAYGGCDGNANRFDTLEECRASCLRIGKERLYLKQNDTKCIHS